LLLQRIKKRRLEMLKICLLGLGRTGKEIAKVLLEQPDMQLVFACCSKGSDKSGKDLGEILNIRNTGIKVQSSANLEKLLIKHKPDVAIDFSNPEATIDNAQILSAHGVNIVIGTTGFNDIQLEKLKQLSNSTGIVYSRKITTGVNVLMLLTNIASAILNNYDFEIIESHFKAKSDIPSGTSKKIAKEILKGKNYSSESLYYDIENISQIPIHAVRAGGIIGKHKVIIAGEYDKIEISHESFSRRVFALGAIKAARFIYDKKGYYEMKDVLNLEKVLYSCLQGDKYDSRDYGLNIVEIPV